MSAFRGARVLASRLWLYEFHSFSCSPRNWQVWSTPLVGTGTRWANQPQPWTHWATSNATRGANGSCPADWVDVDIRNLAQAWADQGFTTAGVMLSAENESDTNGWKKFSSIEGGDVPHIEITYNLRPNAATGLTVSDRADSGGGVTYTRSLTPTLSDAPTDPDGDLLYPTFFVYEGDSLIAAHSPGAVPSGAVATWQLPAGLLQHGRGYRFRASAHDGRDWGPDGFVALRNKLGNRAIEVAGCATAPASPIQLWDYWGGNCQRWNMTYSGDGYWAFGGRGSDLALDVSGCGTANGTVVNLWPYGGSGNHCQAFRLQAAGPGEYKIVSRHANKPLDPLGCTGANGSRLGIWDAYVNDCQVWRVEPAPDAGTSVQWLSATVDTQAPGAPVVSSTDYPNDNTWHRGAGQAGTFTFTPPVGLTDLDRYVWALDATPTTEVAATGQTTVPITPATDGQHTLNVRTKDRAGNLSPITSYTFHVGRAGLVQPAEGIRVVARTKLEVAGEPGFTHVKFVWRRGQGAAVETDVPAANLTRADGWRRR